MASHKQNMGSIYKKLASSWNKKCGQRDCNANVFQGTVATQPLYHVASLMNPVICDIRTRANIVNELKNVDPNVVIGSETANSVWIYDMRASDGAPKTEQDTARLKHYVGLFIKTYFDAHTQNYLLQHINISACFFVWFFSTPNYFYATNETRQTTRYGIQKVWTETLLRKKPSVTPKPTMKLVKQRGEMHQVNVLSKLLNEQETLETKIANLVHSEYPTIAFDWTNVKDVHGKIAECFVMNGKCYINGKKSKKLQMWYHDHQKIRDKVARAKFGIEQSKIQERNEKMAAANMMASIDADGFPPVVKLVRQNAEFPGCETTVWSSSEECSDESFGAEAEVKPEAEDIPESWEDLF